MATGHELGAQRQTWSVTLQVQALVQLRTNELAHARRIFAVREQNWALTRHSPEPNDIISTPKPTTYTEQV